MVFVNLYWEIGLFFLFIRIRVKSSFPLENTVIYFWKIIVEFILRKSFYNEVGWKTYYLQILCRKRWLGLAVHIGKRDICKTQSKIYDGEFSRKSFLQKSSITDDRQGSKYASEEICDKFIPNVCLSTLNMVNMVAINSFMARLII